MGIYDREYYRNEGPSFLESLANRGRVCWWLIAINVGVFIVQIITRRQDGLMRAYGIWDEPFTDAFILDVNKVMDGQVWRLLTYAFLHSTASLWHIFFNMLLLYFFGRELEDMYGPREFLAFYLLAALLGGFAFVAGVKLENAAVARCLGASGAVTAVMVLYACHFPTQVIYFFGVVPVPIWLFVGFEVAQDLFGFLGGAHGNTAVTVHLGGAAFGFLYWYFSWRVLYLWPDIGSTLSQRARRRPNLRVYREEEAPKPRPVPVAAPPANEDDDQFDARVDALLDKIHRDGKASLTESEREFMDKASEIYKRRRS